MESITETAAYEHRMEKELTDELKVAGFILAYHIRACDNAVSNILFEMFGRDYTTQDEFSFLLHKFILAVVPIQRLKVTSTAAKQCRECGNYLGENGCREQSYHEIRPGDAINEHCEDRFIDWVRKQTRTKTIREGLRSRE